MNAEVLAILKDTLICFENGYHFAESFKAASQYQCSHWICNHIYYKNDKNECVKDPLYAMGDVAIEYIAINRPTETLFPEIFNGYAYVQSLKDDSFWHNTEFTKFIRADIQVEKIKYLKLLIAKLQSELNDNTTQIA